VVIGFRYYYKLLRVAGGSAAPVVNLCITLLDHRILVASSGPDTRVTASLSVDE
jgi:hypothetical protein